MASKRDVNLNITATEETGPATAAAGRNVDGLQRKVDGFNTKKPTAEVTRFTSAFTKSAKDGDSAMTTLQKSIDDTETRIRKLRADFNSPGGNGIQLFGDLKNEAANLRVLQNALKAFVPEAEQAGVAAGNSLLNGLENSVSSFSLGPLSGPIGLGIVAAATPIIVSGLAAAISTGVGVGVVGLAAAIDHNNPVIVKQFGKLKDDAVSVFEAAAEPLAAPLAGALSSFDALLHKEAPQIEALFGAAGESVGPLTDGLERLTSDILPVLTKDAQSFADAIKDPQVQASLSALESSATGLFSDLGDPRLVKEGFVALDATLGTTLTLLQGITIAVSALPDGIHYLKDAASFIGKIFTAGPDTATPQLQTRTQVFARLAGNAQQASDAEKAVGQAASVAGPPVAGFGVSLEAAGVIAGNSYPDIQAVGKSMDSMGEHAGTNTPAVEAIGKSMQSMGEHASTSIPAVDAIGKSMTSMGEHAGTSNLATQALGFSVTSLGEHAGTSDPAVLAVGKSMQSMGEHAGTANLATQSAGFAVQSMGEHAGLANPAVDAVGKSMQSLGEHSGSAIGQLDGADAAVKNLAPSAEATAAAFDDLTKSIIASSNAALGAAGDELAVKQGYADFTQALKDNGKGFDENTQKGRNNTQALLDALGPLQKQYEDQVNAGTATQETTAKYDAQVDKLIDLAEKNGLAADSAEDLRKKLEGIRGTYTATVQVHASESAQAAQLLSRSKGGPGFFGDGDYLDSSFAFAPGGGGRGGAAGGPTWTMPPVQIDHSSKLTTYLDGRVVAQSVDRHTASARSHQRHAARVGAL